jgi:hypothetical protein
MDPMIDLDRELGAALDIEPSANFAARVRAQIATEAPVSVERWPQLAFAAVCVAAVTFAASVLTSRSDPAAAAKARLAHHDLIIMTPLREALRPLPRVIVLYRTGVTVHDVVVSQSEMLALRRLFAGTIVAPPAPVVADELAIPEITIEPVVIASPPEGDRQ